MSKNFGKSRRPPAHDKGDEKRPSVFERLGVRRDNQGGMPVDSHAGSRWPDPTKQGHHQGPGKETRPHGAMLGSDKRRNPSFSPPGSSKQMIRKKIDDSLPPHPGKTPKIKESRCSTVGSVVKSPKKGIKESGKHKMRPEKSQHLSKKEKSRKRSKKLEKKKKKIRTSSASSGDSSDDSGSSSSSNSSSSSSSSSNNSSSSDSSVPSVKLKADKSKSKKMKLKGKLGKKQVLVKGIGSSSSGSSSSGLDTSSANLSMKRDRGAADLREKLNARSPSGHSGIKEQYLSKESRGNKIGDVPKRIKHYDRSPPPPQHLDEDRYNPKKRTLPQESSFPPEDVKRRRVLSPPPADKYRPPNDGSPIRHRRAPPQMEIPKQGRVPPPPTGFQKDPHLQRSTLSPMRRPRMDEIRRPVPGPGPDRPDYRNEGDKRNSPFGHNMKPREFDRRREPGPADFGRDNNRPRERVAPTRPPMDNRQERERNMQPDFQRRPRPMPYNPPDHSRGNIGGFRGQPPPFEKDRPRFPPSNSMEERRHVPLLPKNKEALAERYELMKKSGYVDKWVDETVKTVQRTTDIGEPVRPPLLPLPTVRPPISSPDIISTSATSQKPKANVKEPISTIDKIEAEDLSDFSDDADAILNNPDSVPDSGAACGTPRSSEMGDKKSVTDKSTGVETPVTIQRRSASIDTAPSTFSQERSIPKPFVPEGRSLPSQSQTDDDILERMDFEEISEDEFGEVENKVHIVDALGVDWASLVCQEKNSEIQAATHGIVSTKVRKRWNPVNFLSSVGLSKTLMGEKLFNKITELKKIEDSATSDNQTGDNEVQTPIPSKGTDVLDKLGLGPHSRALSSRRGMAMRRYFLELPQKSLLSMDVVHQTEIRHQTPQEMDSIGELYKLSIALLKSGNETPVAIS